MDEFSLVFFICLVLGSSVFLWYYPITTAIAIIAVTYASSKAWSRYRKNLNFEEKKRQRLDRVSRFPEISSVYVPDFETTIQTEIESLKEHLEKKGQIEVISLVESIESMFQQRILPRKDSLEQSLDNYIYTNHVLIEDQLSHNRKKLGETQNQQFRSVIEKTIENLEEKQKLLTDSKDELVWFYSQIKSIFTQLENMKIKSLHLKDPDRLLLDLKEDLNEAFEGLEDASQLLSDLSKL